MLRKTKSLKGTQSALHMFGYLGILFFHLLFWLPSSQLILVICVWMWFMPLVSGSSNSSHELQIGQCIIFKNSLLYWDSLWYLINIYCKKKITESIILFNPDEKPAVWLLLSSFYGGEKFRKSNSLSEVTWPIDGRVKTWPWICGLVAVCLSHAAFLDVPFSSPHPCLWPCCCSSRCPLLHLYRPAIHVQIPSYFLCP